MRTDFFECWKLAENYHPSKRTLAEQLYSTVQAFGVATALEIAEGGRSEKLRSKLAPRTVAALVAATVLNYVYNTADEGTPPDEGALIPDSRSVPKWAASRLMHLGIDNADGEIGDQMSRGLPSDIELQIIYNELKRQFPYLSHWIDSYQPPRS